MSSERGCGTTAKSPVPVAWFGGKSRVAHLVWSRFGDVANYVEPFFGSGSVLLSRPSSPGSETVNDKDGFVANAWRSIAADPDQTAGYADWPVNENDLHARHVWLKERREDLTAKLEGDPDYFDAKIAGWWLWGMSVWIGSGFCGPSGSGPWSVVDGQLVHLGDAGRGVSRQLVHLGNAGHGVSRKRVHLNHQGQEVSQVSGGIYAWFEALASRLRRVRVCCGDWSRICGPAPTVKQGLTGVFLDPPYSAEESRDMNLYSVDSGTVAHDVRAWCMENGNHPLMRIALCGYGDVHDELLQKGWSRHEWRASGGYSNQSTEGPGHENRHRERIWFSPACLKGTQGSLFS